MTLTESPSLLVAGIGEMVLSSSSDAHLVAYGLGSCIALAAWDPRTRVGGLAHFMLPNGPANNASPVKFIDTGLDTFLKAMEAQGVAHEGRVVDDQNSDGGHRRAPTGLNPATDVGSLPVQVALAT